jgi:hypothetical protein
MSGAVPHGSNLAVYDVVRPARQAEGSGRPHRLSKGSRTVITGTEAYTVVAIGAATLSSGTLATAAASAGGDVSGFDPGLITQGTVATIIVAVSLFFIRRSDRASTEERLRADAAAAVERENAKAERERFEGELAKKDELIADLLNRLLNATPPNA